MRKRTVDAIIAATLIACLLLPMPATSAPKVLTAHELNITQKWLRSIGDNESGLLLYDMSLPFHFDTASDNKTCAGKYSTEASLKQWIRCMKRDEKLLMKLLAEDSSPELIYSLPMSRINQMRDSINSQGRWVPIAIEGFDNNNEEVGAYLLVLFEDGKISRLLADILYME